ncbi:MAG: (2Fe-2S) ferredoxin domain-containing protein [Cyanobacteria bacterium RU_5_0]|nr:(2Fe-2S) ferredoxin domain-containing protein [Cyanobacteria bacterium RU_5_0]
MSKYDPKEVSEFNLEGRFLGFAAKDGYKLKYLRLSTTSGEHVIKLSKELRFSLYFTLKPGDWIQVSGSRKVDWEKGKTKLKAYHVAPATPNAEPQNSSVILMPPPLPAVTVPQKTKANILVCQKSDCCKRGGRAIVEALERGLGDRGLTLQVSIKPTGCMKRCKEGPNLVMPDKTRYSQIRPEAVPALLEKHFPPTDAQTVEGKLTV